MGPMSLLYALHCTSAFSVFTASSFFFWLSWSLFMFSCSAALCRAASTSSLKSLKSWVGKSSGGVGGGVLKKPLVGLGAIVVLVRQAVLAPCSSASLNRLCVSSLSSAWTEPSLPGKPAPVRMAVAVFPRRLRSKVGAERMTDGRC